MLVVANPCFVNFRMYVPGVALGKTYCPDWFVFTVLLSFVAGLIRSTVVSGIAPPFGSLTVPRMTPVVAVWPKTGIVETMNNSAKLIAWTRNSRFMAMPHHKSG